MDSAPRNTVFISYAHEDSRWCDEFKGMLESPSRTGVEVWSDHHIAAGANWRNEIEAALDRARVALLLVTQDFLKSRFISDVEVRELLGAARSRGLTICWVPVSASMVEYSELGALQACRSPDKTLDRLTPARRKQAVKEICDQILALLNDATPLSSNRKEQLRNEVQRQLGRRCAIKEEISLGKFSVLYRAEREQPKQSVAIKVFAASALDEWARAKFVESVNQAARLRSRAFMGIYEYALERSPEYLVCELVNGKRLSEHLRGFPHGLPLADAKAILLDLAHAIDEIHARGLQRGEICPSDILIDESGAARISPVNFTNVLRAQGEVSGNYLVDRESLSYMTPERYYGNPATPATDQYSLGLIATELLSGRQIRRVAHPCDLALRETLFADLESGRYDWAARSAEFSGVVSRMLRKDPARRWPSMKEVVRRLNDVEVAESARDRDRKLANSGYVEIIAAGGPAGERKFFSKFYRNLFESSADFEPMFEALDMERQYQVLSGAISSLLDFRADDSGSRQQLEALSARHARLGLTPRHYGLFLDAFMKTLAEYRVDRSALEAWRATLTPGIEFIATYAGAAAPRRPARRSQRNPE